MINSLQSVVSYIELIIEGVSKGSGCLVVVGGVGLEVVLEGRQEMTQDGYTPGFAKQPLPATLPQISHINVIIRKCEQPVQGWPLVIGKINIAWYSGEYVCHSIVYKDCHG